MPKGAGCALNSLGLHYSIEHSLLCHFCNSQGETGGWSSGRICHQCPSPSKEQLLPILCLVLSGRPSRVLSFSLHGPTGWRQKNLFNLVNGHIYIFNLFFQWLWSPKENKITKVRTEGWRWCAFLCAKGRRSRASLTSFPCAPRPFSVSEDHRGPGCRRVNPSTLLLFQLSPKPRPSFSPLLCYCHEFPRDSCFKPLNYDTVIKVKCN